MAVTHEQLMAFVDRELSPAEERKVMSEIAANPDYATYVEEQKTLKSRLTADFAPVIAEPVPDRFERMILDQPAARTTTTPNILRRLFSSAGMSRTCIPAAAAAAGIAIGIGISGLFGTGAVLQDRNGALVAGDELSQQLTTQLASDQSASAPVRIGLSFVDRNGDYCRTFATSGGGGDALAGVACRTRDTWRIVATAAAQSSEHGQFRPAAASMPDSLRTVVNDIMSGQPLNAVAERTARDQGWIRP